MQASVYLSAIRGGVANEVEQAFRAEIPAAWGVECLPSADAICRRLEQQSQPAIVVLCQPARGGAAAVAKQVRRVRQADSSAPIVIAAQSGDVESAAQAIAAGASDFLVCAENLRQRVATLLGKLRGLLEALDRNRRLDQDNADLRAHLQQPIVGRSPQIRRLLAQIRSVARVPRPVLIVGERGVGKELVARAIHLAAGPAARPMVTVNCAAYNDALLESELFGHERGAFTGAESLRRGKFEQADGGALLLDEIGNMSPAFQEKILRVVEYGTFSRVGGTEELHTTARIIAATNRDLKAEIAAGAFLPDLYDRLTFATIEVPPLRDRKGDIPILAQWFLEQFARETPAVAGKLLSPAAVAALAGYDFPGNVRELKNILERAACRDTGAQIEPEDLGLAAQPAPVRSGSGFHQRLQQYARQLVVEALAQAGGNQAQAARALGLPYHQLRYYVRKYDAESRACPNCGGRNR